MNYNKALVTGGAGFIGSHIVDMLIESGIKVVVLDDLSVGKKENVHPDAELIQGDIRDINLVDEIIRNDIDIVFHQAARVSIRASVENCYEDADINLMGTINLLRACRNTGVKKFLFASSMGVYADSPLPEPVNEQFPAEPASPYGIAKLAAEKYCRLLCKEASIQCHILRYFNTYGPRQTFTPYVGVITIFTTLLLENRRPVIFGDGEQLRDYVHVRDVARANILAMQKDIPELTINIGTGRAVSVNEIFHMLRSRINPGIEPVYEAERAGELKISFPDISRAQKTIGYMPVHKLEEEIDGVIKYIKETRN